jgi:hypothetical protein
VLKITRTETAAEEKWTLHGRLEGLWVSELRRIWKKAHRTDNTLKCIVDLNDVTSLDRSGERLSSSCPKKAWNSSGLVFTCGTSSTTSREKVASPSVRKAGSREQGVRDELPVAIA